MLSLKLDVSSFRNSQPDTFSHFYLYWQSNHKKSLVGHRNIDLQSQNCRPNEDFHAKHVDNYNRIDSDQHLQFHLLSIFVVKISIFPVPLVQCTRLQH